MTSLQTLIDKSVAVLSKNGILPSESDENHRLAELLHNVVDIDEPNVMAIAATVRYIGSYSQLVRDNVQDMRVGARYGDITRRFSSIQEDLKMVQEHVEDGKITFAEKAQFFWMRLTRGTTHHRFQEIQEIYQEVMGDTKVQIDKANEIMEGYLDFRLALSHTIVLANKVFAKQKDNFRVAKETLEQAASAVTAYEGTDVVRRSELELVRDEAKRAYDIEEKRFDLVKDVAEIMKAGLDVGDIMVTEMQNTNGVKERLYRRGVAFFELNEQIFSLMDALYTMKGGLHETTETIGGMEKGIDSILGNIAITGHELEKAAIRAGYGSIYNPETLQKVADSIVEFTKSVEQLKQEGRDRSTAAVTRIGEIATDLKRRSAEATYKFLPEPEQQA